VKNFLKNLARKYKKFKFRFAARALPFLFLTTTMTNSVCAATPLDLPRAERIVKSIGWAMGVPVSNTVISVMLNKLGIDTDEAFNMYLASGINKTQLWDKKEIYVWEKGKDTKYPDPIEYKDIIETEESIILYGKNNEFVMKCYKDRISAVKVRYYFEDVLCYYGDLEQQKTMNRGDQKKELLKMAFKAGIL